LSEERRIAVDADPGGDRERRGELEIFRVGDVDPVIDAVEAERGTNNTRRERGAVMKRARVAVGYVRRIALSRPPTHNA